MNVSEQLVLSGHLEDMSLGYSNEDNVLISLSSSWLKIWDFQSGANVMSLAVDQWLGCLVVMNSTTFPTVNYGGRLEIWKLKRLSHRLRVKN